MAGLAAEKGLKALIAACADRMRPLGYRRSGAALRKLADGNVAVIEFQKSRDNTADYLRFTVNLAIICGSLYEAATPIERAGANHGHLTLRLGKLFAEPMDKWWGITEGADVEALAAEVSGLVVTLGAPFLEERLRTEDLAAYWKAGGWPGGKMAEMRLKRLAEAGVRLPD